VCISLDVTVWEVILDTDQLMDASESPQQALNFKALIYQRFY
jgi:hypothetical protein